MTIFPKKQTAVGIDISDYSIEVLQLGKEREVLFYGRTTLKEGIVRDGEILKKEELVKKLKELLEKTIPEKLKAKSSFQKAVLSLPESRVFLYKIMSKKALSDDKLEELKENVVEEASKMIPFPLEKTYWNFEEVPQEKQFLKEDFESEREELKEFLYVASPKEIVDSYTNVMEKAGIDPLVLDIESASLGRSLLNQKDFSSCDASMIVDIGARTTNLSIFNSKGYLILSITIPLAGQNFTKNIASKLGIKEEAAEKLKRRWGFKKKGPGKEISAILERDFERIVKEIKEALGYCKEKYNQNIKEIILAGGSALLPKVDEYLTTKLSRKVVIGNPLEKLKNATILKRKKRAVLFANVIGLALRGSGSNLFLQGMNLLPTKFKRYQVHRFEKSGFFKAIKTKFFNFVPSLSSFSKKNRLFVLVFVIVVLSLLGFSVFKTKVFQKVKKEEPQAEPSSRAEVTPLVATSGEELLPEEKETTQELFQVVIEETPTGWLNVREGPGTNYPKITKALVGETYTFLEEKNGWYKIEIKEGQEGWVTSQYTKKIVE